MAPKSNKSKDSKKALPNKYAKLLHFGVWILSNLDISKEERNIAFEKMCVYANVESQVDFYENFYTEEKEIAKSMRKFIAEMAKENRKSELAIKGIIVPKGRDQLLRDIFIDSVIARFNRDRVNI
jgi:hypothetical protein